MCNFLNCENYCKIRLQTITGRETKVTYSGKLANETASNFYIDFF